MKYVSGLDGTFGFSGRSFIYARKSMGPRTELCGTPDNLLNKVDVLSCQGGERMAGWPPSVSNKIPLLFPD